MIELGEYVRTDKGNIGKVIETRLGTNDEFKTFINLYFLNNKLWTIEEYVKKHSKNIIDLIEVGDYVNGYRVEKIKNGYVYVNYCWDCELYALVTNDSDNIKSIVTKEQFASMEYR